MLQPKGYGARACAAPSPLVRPSAAIRVRKIAKVRVGFKNKPSASASASATATPTPQASAMQLVLGGGHPELVELIMGLIEPDPDKDPKEAQEQAMQGVLSWASLNRTNRALFHHTHLKWWKALLKKHVGIDGSTLKARSVVPFMSDKTYHSFYADIYRNLVRERKERERKEAEAKAKAEAKMALWEAERGISIRRAEEHADHFENTDQYQRWMLHTSMRDPRELELTHLMRRAERLVHDPKHEEAKGQWKERQEMAKQLSALRERRKEWQVFRTAPKPFVQMMGALAEAVRAMEAAMGLVGAIKAATATAPKPEPNPEPNPEMEL